MTDAETGVIIFLLATAYAVFCFLVGCRLGVIQGCKMMVERIRKYG